MARLPPPTPLPDATWRGAYYANTNLHGDPVLMRFDRDIHFDWGLDAPAANLPVDGFSVSWTRAVVLAAGRWHFHATVDDGVRVYVDGIPVIDQWHNTAAATYNTTVDLSEGYHSLRVDYYENSGQALIQVWWEHESDRLTDGGTYPGTWRGDYYNNKHLSGDPLFSWDDPAVYFDWGDDGPGEGLDGQSFSARWNREVLLPGGRYRFRVRADDGVRLWFDWATIIDEWHENSGETTYTYEMDVTEGNHILVVEYYQSGGDALVQVTWEATDVNWIGNLYTCMAMQDSWIKVYRLTPNGQWEDLRAAGYGPMAADGTLSLFGLPLDAYYGWDGQPHKVELWIKGNMVRSEGDILAGQPAFRIKPGQDARTAWPCGAELPR
jgi:hypothetical protein